jgi:TolA-binding protein
MKVGSIILVLLLVAGLATGAWMLRTPEFETAPAVHFDASADTEDRLLALERAVAGEREARQLLEEELQVLYAEIDRLSESDQPGEQRVVVNENAEENISEAPDRRTRRFSSDPEERRDVLIEGGFSPDRAEWLAVRESELQMEAMQARFEQRRSGEPFDPFDPSLNPGAALRAEIGDTEYEQYLEASGRPISVRVGAVLESSPGQRAGMLPGDEIIRYDGQRVFNSFELNQQTMSGEPGESVVVDVKRDGVLMQVVVPRGPIGVTTGRGYRGRRGG